MPTFAYQVQDLETGAVMAGGLDSTGRDPEQIIAEAHEMWRKVFCHAPLHIEGVNDAAYRDECYLHETVEG
jgi:hypothetical protein